MSKNDGGPAFPQPLATTQDGGVYHTNHWDENVDGMSLRDYAYIQFMAALISRTGEAATCSAYRAIAWAEADAMIAAREQE